MWGRFQAVPGGSRGLQGPPGGSGGSRPTNPASIVLNENAPCHEPWARLKFHAGWSGWTRPPVMAGGAGGGGRLEACLQKGVKGFFGI